jgi:tripartite-type tricarboxylate transporter receptor subunit TctC
MKTNTNTITTTSRRDFIKIAGLTAGMLAVDYWGNVPHCLARDIYPAEKITYIIPNKPGGGHDTYARAISPYLTRYLQQLAPGARGGQLLLKNEPAAAGRKGYSLLFSSRPDGYTIGAIDTAPVTDNIMGTSEFDFTKLTFLLLAVSTTKMIVTNKKGYKNWQELQAAMKKEPVKMAVGSFGRANHVSGIVINEKMKTNFKLIPLPGTAESMNALLRGDVQTSIVSEDAAKPLIDAKEVKVLLVFDEKSEYPGAISVKEAGFPELADDISSHRFVVAPPKLAPEPKRILIEALKKVNADKDFLAWAKKAEYPLRNLYGNDAEKTFRNIIKTYDDLTPLLKKHLS